LVEWLVAVSIKSAGQFGIGRWQFISTLCGASLAWPLAARAQRPRPARIGALHPFSPPHPWIAGLRRGLLDLGYVEGRTITIDERGSDGRDERLDGLAQELIDSKVDALVALTGPPFRARGGEPPRCQSSWR
jgi:putative ABC transport system substrate-binding protein